MGVFKFWALFLFLLTSTNEAHLLQNSSKLGSVVEISPGKPKVICEKNVSKYDKQLNLCVSNYIYGKMQARSNGMLTARSLGDRPIYRIEKASSTEVLVIFSDSLEKLRCPLGLQVESSSLKCVTSKKMVCYIRNWARYQNDFSLSRIPVDLCTHIMYSFLTLNDLGEVRLSEYKDAYEIEEIVKRRGEASLEKVILTVGGWTYSGPVKGKWFDLDSMEEYENRLSFEEIWNNMLTDRASRRRFVDSIIQLGKHFGTDGVEIDYEYPACPWNNCAEKYSCQSENFIFLLSELRERAGNNYHISLAMSNNFITVLEGPSISKMEQLVNFFSIMTYDYNVYEGDFFSAHNQNKRKIKNTIDFFVHNLQVETSKILLGVSMYGRGYRVSEEDYRLSIEKNIFHGRRTIDKSPIFENSNEKGIIFAKELCSIRPCAGGSGNHEGKMYIEKETDVKLSRRGNTDTFVSCRQSYFSEKSGGSWLLFDQNMVSYTDVLDMNILAKILHENKLGGYLVYAIDQDDYDGSCKFGSFPFLRYLRETLDHVNETMDNILWTPPKTVIAPEEDYDTPTVTPGKPTTIPPSIVNNCVNTVKCAKNGFSVSKCDCSKYFQCYEGAVYSLTCPTGLVFNEVKKYCDFRANVEIPSDITCYN